MLISSVLNVKKSFEKFLCNLHNEVFEVAESCINTECSLTASEGISNKFDEICKLVSFLTASEGISV